jgi:hypothetical protein
VVRDAVRLEQHLPQGAAVVFHVVHADRGELREEEGRGERIRGGVDRARKRPG